MKFLLPPAGFPGKSSGTYRSARISFFLLFLFFLPGVSALQAQTEQQWMKRGDSLALYGYASKAIEAYQHAAALNPKNATAYAGQAAETFDLGRFNEGKVLLDKAFLADPKNAQALILKARLALLSNQLPAARQICNDILSREPNNTRALLTRAMVNDRAGSNASAVLDYDAAVESDTVNLEARLMRAEYNNGKSYYSVALRDLQVVVREAPLLPSAWYSRGMCYSRLLDWDHALSDFNQCLALDSLHREAILARGTVYFSKQDLARALEDYNHYERFDTTDALLYFNRADLYYQQELLDASCADCMKAQRISIQNQNAEMLNDINISISDYCDSSKASYYYQRGIAAFNSNKFAEAVNWYDKGLAKFTDNALLLNFRGNAYLAMNTFDKAEQDYAYCTSHEASLIAAYHENTRFATLKASDPLFQTLTPQARMMRAEALLSLGRADEAYTEINSAIDKLPEPRLVPSVPIGQFYFVRGIILYQLGRKQEAISDLDRANSAMLSAPEPYYYRALVRLNDWYDPKNKSRMLYFSYKDANSSAHAEFPVKVKKARSDDNVTAALADLDKAIEYAPGFADAWFIRGQVKMQLKRSDACYDLYKARELGDKRAQALIDASCK